MLISGFAAPSFASSPDESNYCSAMTVDRDGKLDEQVRVECDSDYAGRCLQEVKTQKGWDWQIADDKVCAMN